MEKVKIKNIFDFQKKSKIKAGDGFKLGEAQYPFYTSSNELTKSINEYLFEDESLIFGTGGLASIHFCNEKFAVSTDCFVIQPKDKKRVFSKFVYYYLSGNMNILENGFKGAGLKHISKDYLENIEIPLPNLATQQRIAAILDQADAIIQNNRAIVQKYDALTQSLFLDMFGDPVKNEKGWEKRKLNDFLEVLVDVGSNGGNDWVSANIKMKDEEDYALMIRTVNLNKNDFENNLKYVSEETYNLFKKTKVYGGEIIMNKIGSAGEFWLMPYLNRPVSLGLNQLMMTFKNLDKFYFYFYFSTNYGKKLINSKLNGATTKSITKTALRDLDILYPPMELQNQFAERVAMIEAQKQQAQLELAKSEELFASLLQRAFNGELN